MFEWMGSTKSYHYKKLPVLWDTFLKINSQINFSQVNAIRNAIKKELELPIIEISDSNAKLDGGDVLFTG